MQCPAIARTLIAFDERARNSGRSAGPAHVAPYGAVLAGAVAMAVFVYTSGYRGVVHDAQLYAFQALARLHPAELAGDLFLRYGSQDRYSLFSPLYAPLTEVLGVPGAALAVTLASLLVLFAATWTLLVPWRGAVAATAGTLAVATWPVGYGAELVSPGCRAVCDPAAARGRRRAVRSRHGRQRGRPVPAFALLGLALLIHPLMALPAVGGRHSGRSPTRPGCRVSDRCWALAILAGAWAGIPVLEQLVRSMDAEWRAAVLQRSPFLSPLHWSSGDWSLAGVAVLSPLLVGLRLDGALRRLYVAAGVVGALGVAATLIGSDLAGSALVMQVQPWRALWLSHWLGVAGIGLLLVQYDAHRNEQTWSRCWGLIGAELSAANTGVVVLGVALWATWVLGRRVHWVALARMALGATLAMVGPGGALVPRRPRVDVERSPRWRWRPRRSLPPCSAQPRFRRSPAHRRLPGSRRSCPGRVRRAGAGDCCPLQSLPSGR